MKEVKSRGIERILFVIHYLLWIFFCQRLLFAMLNMNMLAGVWKHECDCVFSDKLTVEKDKESYENYIREIGCKVSGEDLYNAESLEKSLW